MNVEEIRAKARARIKAFVDLPIRNLFPDDLREDEWGDLDDGEELAREIRILRIVDRDQSKREA